jgi:hypothetical protein
MLEVFFDANLLLFDIDAQHSLEGILENNYQLIAFQQAIY